MSFIPPITAVMLQRHERQKRARRRHFSQAEAAPNPNDLAVLIQSPYERGRATKWCTRNGLSLGTLRLLLGERIKLALLTHYHRLPGSAVPGLTFAPEDKEKGLGSETQVHHAQDSVIIDLAKDVVDRQGIVDHRR